jgi:chromosome segregation ATPase
MVDINKTLTQVALLLHELGGTGAREKYSRAAEAVDLVLQAIEAQSASVPEDVAKQVAFLHLWAGFPSLSDASQEDLRTCARTIKAQARKIAELKTNNRELRQDLKDYHPSNEAALLVRAEAAEARIAELTRERDALDANRNRLIAVINSNLNERDEDRAQVTELTKERDALLASLPSLDNTSARGYVVAEEALDQVTALTIENAVLRDVLQSALEKLMLYRAGHSGEYVGGMEYVSLVTRIGDALTEGEKG